MVSRAEYDKVVAKNAALELRVAQLQRMLFGPKSERFVPQPSPSGQLALFADAPSEAEVEEKKTIEVPAHRRNVEKRTAARQKLPEHLPRLRQIIEPDFDTTGMEVIGEEVTEQLLFSPAKLFVLELVRKKYILKEDAKSGKENQIKIASLPDQFAPRSIPHITLLAWLSVEKYVYHSPLYRSSARLSQSDYYPPRSTLSGWIALVAQNLKILYEELGKVVFRGPYLQADETHYEVQLQIALDENRKPNLNKNKAKTKKKTHRGYLWGYLGMAVNLIFFEYDEGRSANNPMKRLKDYTGVVQTDCYEIYDQVAALASFTHCHDMAHARRKFEDCLKYDKEKAEAVLYVFQDLFMLERKAREEKYTEEQVQEMRNNESKPIIDGLFDWMEEEQYKELPKSPILKAINYMLSRPEKMRYFLQNPIVRIDTNPIENLIRPIAIGRKNYLFAGSHEAAQNAAILYSFFGSCRAYGIDPYIWLLDVMGRINTTSIHQLEELLPHKWKKSDQCFDLEKLMNENVIVEV